MTNAECVKGWRPSRAQPEKSQCKPSPFTLESGRSSRQLRRPARSLNTGSRRDSQPTAEPWLDGEPRRPLSRDLQSSTFSITGTEHRGHSSYFISSENRIAETADWLWTQKQNKKPLFKQSMALCSGPDHLKVCTPDLSFVC